MHDRLEAQDAFAFGVRLQRQVSEVDLEDREVPPRFLDHDCLLILELLTRDCEPRPDPGTTALRDPTHQRRDETIRDPDNNHRHPPRDA
jgi:hypothetical protein